MCRGKVGKVGINMKGISLIITVPDNFRFLSACNLARTDRVKIVATCVKFSSL